MKEGEDQIAAFLARNTEFAPVPYAENWPFADRAVPPTDSPCKDYLRMAPHSHETDGFFIAVLGRVQ